MLILLGDMNTPISKTNGLPDIVQHREITANGVRMHYVEGGEGPPVLLLHGFPEFWRGWRYQIPALVEAGYHVIAPDQRGYNLSEKPRGIRAYELDKLTGDVIGLMDAVGLEKVTLIGHDWGAIVAWWVAVQHPERLDGLINLHVPHPVVMRKHLMGNLAQIRKSWYVFFFQLPWLPEAMIRAGNWRAGVRTMQSTSRPGTYSDDDMELYRQAWSQPGAMTGMINWYRAMRYSVGQKVSSPRVTVPTLLIWGAKDFALSREMAQPSIDLCTQGRLEMIEEATHWVQHEEPERVNKLMLDFLMES